MKAAIPLWLVSIFVLTILAPGAGFTVALLGCVALIALSRKDPAS